MQGAEKSISPIGLAIYPKPKKSIYNLVNAQKKVKCIEKKIKMSLK